MSNVAVNDAGDVVIFDGQAWRPAPVAQNGRGERVYFDGQAWQPLQMRAPEPVVDAARAAGGAVGGAVQRVADVPGSWWSRRARDLIEGPAAALDAIADAMNPSRGVPRMLMTADQRARVMPGALDYARGGADAAGLATPQTPGERMTSAVVQGAAGAIPTLGAGLIARAPAVIGGVTGAASQIIGGGAGGAAAEGAAQGGYGPITQTVAGLAGGLGAAGATQVAGAALRGAGAAAQPLTAGGRERLVVDTLLQSSDDPATLAQRVRQGIDSPDARLPNSPFTTAQAARDPRLFRVESSIAQSMPEIATPIRDVQIARARAQESAIAAMADGRSPGERGADVRGERGVRGQPGSGLRGAEQARRQAVSEAYRAIDPDGTAQLPMAPIRGAMVEEMATRWGPGAGDMPPPLRSLFADLEAAGDAQSWQFMQRIRSRAAAIAGDPAADARAQATARRVVEGVDEAAERAALPVQPAPGAPRTMEDIDRIEAAEGLAARPDVVAAMGDVRSATADRRAMGLSLVQFLRQNRGIREEGGDVNAAVGGNRAMPGLISGQGLTLERAMQAAIDAGYYPGRSLQHDAYNPGAALTRTEFLRDISEEVNRRSARFPEQRRAAIEDVQERAALRREVEREGVDLTGSPVDAGRMVRPVEGEAAGMARPDGTFSIPEEARFTPEQAARWREAAALRRQMGEDFNRDTTGANATGRILATADFGAPRIADEAVPSAALANVSSLRQVLRASGDDPRVRAALQGEFVDRMARAAMGTSEVVDSQGIAQRTMSAAGFRRFWDQNRVMGRMLFSGPELRRLELLARDFSEASIAANTGAARGSQTAQNLSVAAMIARASNGLLDPSNPIVSSFMRPIRFIYRDPEMATREIFGQAMADPRFAAMLLARASPNAVRRATAYVEQNMGARFQEAAITGGTRQAIRTGTEEERRQAP